MCSENLTTPLVQAHLPTIVGDEVFDVVDAHDKVLHQESRTNIHRGGLRHRAVHVFVFNRQGHLFLQRRSLSKDSAPGKWVSSCSGHVDAGESYEAAAIRELGEEIGLYGVPLEPLFRVSPCKQTGNEFVWLYTCQNEGPFALDPDEISEGKWIGLNALSDWIGEQPRDFAWSFLHLWQIYCNR
ncbi:MAG: NUDIX hydrolase [Puniceicoccaceae bacterium MED-G30]|jgi:isopentenyl-diphosphate delta-isomerase|nr:MAG: NUDIX hydrolase [Puniceicoccaceae bacterium MED-G30]|tara:strand:- start:10803 stop:11354 length:552 start_codon:yes stop_codon:yes gene_type:complete